MSSRMRRTCVDCVIAPVVAASVPTVDIGPGIVLACVCTSSPVSARSIIEACVSTGISDACVATGSSRLFFRFFSLLSAMASIPIRRRRRGTRTPQRQPLVVRALPAAVCPAGGEHPVDEADQIVLALRHAHTVVLDAETVADHVDPRILRCDAREDG